MSSTQHKNKTGFTLVEMLVVLAVVGLLASAFFLTMHEPIREASVDATYASVISAFESVRARSMQGVGAGNSGIQITRNDVSIISSNAPDDPIKTVKLAPNIETNHDDSVIFFERISGATTGSDTIEIELRDVRTDTMLRVITVSPDGTVN